MGTREKKIIIYLAVVTPLMKYYRAFCHLLFVNDIEICRIFRKKNRHYLKYKNRHYSENCSKLS